MARWRVENLRLVAALGSAAASKGESAVELSRGHVQRMLEGVAFSLPCASNSRLLKSGVSLPPTRAALQLCAFGTREKLQKTTKSFGNIFPCYATHNLGH